MGGNRNNNLLVYLIASIAIFVLVYQVIIGHFIRNKCEADSLKQAVETATPQEIPNYDKRSFVQKEYKSYLYNECLKEFWLWNF